MGRPLLGRSPAGGPVRLSPARSGTDPGVDRVSGPLKGDQRPAASLQLHGGAAVDQHYVGTSGPGWAAPRGGPGQDGAVGLGQVGGGQGHHCGQQSQQAQLDSFLIVITLFLGLALVIALVGITNTLALSVFERTREIGLLRAMGMTRRQLRRSIRWEAAIVAVFGALLGVAVGVVFGVAATLALPDAFVNDVRIPWATLALYVAVSAAAGLIAAIGPARRAGRMNVLNAIAYE